MPREREREGVEGPAFAAIYIILVKKYFPSPTDIPEVNAQTTKGTATLENNRLNTVEKGLVIKRLAACNPRPQLC